jgi:hypothetical protein
MPFETSVAPLECAARLIAESVGRAASLSTFAAERMPTLRDYHSKPDLSQAAGDLWTAAMALVKALPFGWIMPIVLGYFLLHAIGQMVVDRHRAIRRGRELRTWLDAPMQEAPRTNPPATP